MEDAVDLAAARIRGAFVETLEAIRNQYVHDATQTRCERAFARLVTRKRPLGSGGSGREIDWRTLLLTLFRRFAGELAVEGKLLNHEEIEVRRIVRVRHGGRGAIGADECYVLNPSHIRFLVRCRDAPTAQIGSVVKAVSVKNGGRVVPGVESLLPTVSFLSETDESQWKAGNERDISSSTSVFGFEVDQFTVRSSHFRRTLDPDDSEDEDCGTNAAIMKDITFSDLRGVSRMMEAYHLAPSNWACLLTNRSTKLSQLNGMEESHPWSYISLGKAQKKLWAKERLERGDSLRRKGRLQECLDEYMSAVRLDEDNSEPLLKRGQVLMELRQYEDAMHNFEKLLEIDPANEQANKSLIRARGKLGYSKRVVTAQFVALNQSPSRNKQDTSHTTEENKNEEVPAPPAGSTQAVALEKDRLRRLLEEEENRRKQSRRKSSSRRRGSSSEDSSSGTDTDSKRHKKRQKGSKKSSKSRDRKKRKKSSRGCDDEDNKGRRRRHRRRDESPPRDESELQRNRKSRGSRRSNSWSRSSPRLPTDSKHDQPHPILSRQPHRLWN